MSMTVFGHLILDRFLQFYFSAFSFVLASIGKKYQTLETVFDHISIHLEVCQKYSAGNVVKHSI